MLEKRKDALRLFFGIRLSEEVKLAISKMAKDLQEKCESLRASDRNPWKGQWIAPENYHITLKFLGFVPISQVNEIIRSVSLAIQNQNSFYLNSIGVGAFPNFIRPKVLWVGMKQPYTELIQLTQNIENALSILGFPAEIRPFFPHITFARVKRSKNLTQFNLPNPSIHFGVSLIREIILYESISTSYGSRYNEIHRFLLNSPE
jgi:2'-5' RNA ligase